MKQLQSVLTWHMRENWVSVSYGLIYMHMFTIYNKNMLGVHLNPESHLEKHETQENLPWLAVIMHSSLMVHRNYPEAKYFEKNEP